MNIFEQTQSKKELDLLEAQTQFFNKNKGALNRLVIALEFGHNLIWHPETIDPIKSHEFTPQEMCDSFGTGAAGLFAVSNKIRTLLAEVYPSYKAPELEYDFTINADGTVIIGDKIVSEEDVTTEENETA